MKKLDRIFAATLAAFHGLGGLIMLIDPAGWYDRIPGVVESGPYNPHFVLDIGLAFLAASVGFALFAWRRDLWPAAVAGASFPALHAVLHLYGLATGAHPHALFDISLVIVPAVLGVLVAWSAFAAPRNPTN